MPLADLIRYKLCENLIKEFAASISGMRKQADKGEDKEEHHALMLRISDEQSDGVRESGF